VTSLKLTNTSQNDELKFFGLEPTADELLWHMPITSTVVGATGTLHGGCALAAVVGALEVVTGRQLAYASAQYLSRVELGSEVTIQLELNAVGNKITQAAGNIIGDGGVVLRALCGFGGRTLPEDRCWIQDRELGDPLLCSKRPQTSETGVSFTDSTDIRIAQQTPGDGVVQYWARLPGTLASTTMGLTALADLLPSGMRVSLNKAFRGSSLDNAIRLGQRLASEWILIEIESFVISQAIGHGVVRIFSEDGKFLGSATQSFAITKITGELDR